MNRRFWYREKIFCTRLYTLFSLDVKIEHFHMESYGDWLNFGANLKWQFEELQILALLRWFNLLLADVSA